MSFDELGRVESWLIRAKDHHFNHWLVPTVLWQQSNELVVNQIQIICVYFDDYYLDFIWNIKWDAKLCEITQIKGNHSAALYFVVFFLFCQRLYEGAQLMMCLCGEKLPFSWRPIMFFLPHLCLLGILVTCNAAKWEEKHRRQFNSALHFWCSDQFSNP